MENMEIQERRENPVDVIELVASSHEWEFERFCDDEIAVAVIGRCTEYSVSFSWLEECEALHLGCAFDFDVPENREVEVLRLLAKINEQLLVGHFDLWPKENAVMFRHSLLLSGGAEATSHQAERLLGVALENCERFYQAFHFVVQGGKTAGEALAWSLFETVGNA
nr:YbjN domain-containing protein [Aureimonas psammosilenae]